MTTQKYKPHQSWNRTAFEKLRATWSPARIAEDEAMLAEVFAHAETIPTAKAALDWAREHDMEFFVDRTVARGVSGYYTTSTGVIGISLATLQARNDMGSIIDTLTHEIRHAWQDCHGIRKDVYDSSFTHFLTTEALIEADATAYGVRARHEYRRASLPREESEAMTWREKPEDLRQQFQWWFQDGVTPSEYGGYTARVFAKVWGLYKVPRNIMALLKREEQKGEKTPKGSLEFSLKKMPMGEAFDITNVRGLMRLGEDFSGASNYLVDIPVEKLSREILCPSLARSFWHAVMRPDEEELVAALHKTEIYQKLAAPKFRPKLP